LTLLALSEFQNHKTHIQQLRVGFVVLDWNILQTIFAGKEAFFTTYPQKRPDLQKAVKTSFFLLVRWISFVAT